MQKLVLCFVCIVFVESAPNDEVVMRIKEFLAAVDSGLGTELVKPFVTKDFTVTDGGYTETGNDALDLLLGDVEPNSIAHNLNEDLIKIVIPNVKKLIEVRGMFEWDEDDDGELDYCGAWLGWLKRDSSGQYRFSEMVYSDDMVFENDDELCVVDNFPLEREETSSEYEEAYSSEYYEEES